jgi:hypothetical protein
VGDLLGRTNLKNIIRNVTNTPRYSHTFSFQATTDTKIGKTTKEGKKIAENVRFTTREPPTQWTVLLPESRLEQKSRNRRFSVGIFPSEAIKNVRNFQNFQKSGSCCGSFGDTVCHAVGAYYTKPELLIC